MFFRSRQTQPSEEALEEALTRSVVEIIPSKEALKKELMSGKKLRIKLGIDPTSPHLHLGRSVALLKMRDFQTLGHQIIPIVGDFTGVIGDTSDKDAERPMLDSTTIEHNKKSYFKQAGRLLNMKHAEPRYNSEWLQKLNYHNIGEQADQFSVADFIARELIKKRLDEGKRVSLREVLYPLMQGYDSVAIRADVELGGTDQRFNLLAGRVLQEHYKQRPQYVVIIGPLIPGTDGRKMSSSWGNTINLDDAPNEMFGKVMSIPDSLIETYLIHTTRIPLATVASLMALHPKEAKMALASELVRMYHGAEAAQKAQTDFEATFSKGGVPDVVESVSARGMKTVLDVLVQNKIVMSNSELRRLVAQGAITYMESGTKVGDVNQEIHHGVYKIGKHRFVKIVP